MVGAHGGGRGVLVRRKHAGTKAPGQKSDSRKATDQLLGWPWSHLPAGRLPRLLAGTMPLAGRATKCTENSATKARASEGEHEASRIVSLTDEIEADGGSDRVGDGRRAASNFRAYYNSQRVSGLSGGRGMGGGRVI